MSIEDIRARAKEFPCTTAGHIDCTRLDRDRLLAALDAVLELHFRMPGGGCCGCFTAYGEREVEWPCDTVESITKALR